MSEVEKDVRDRRAEEEAISGKNGNASKLIDAALLIFIVTGFSIVTSIFYVSGLSFGSDFDFRVYFDIKDYLEVTSYWLGSASVTVIILIFIFYGIKYHFVRLNREPGQKRFPWTVSILAALIVLCLLLFFFARHLLPGLLVVASTAGMYYFLNTKLSEGFGGTLVEKVRSRPLLWLGVKLLFIVGWFGYMLGFWWEPDVFRKGPISTIYLAGSNSEVRGRVLFSLTQYLLAMREDETVVAIPVAKVDRIETPRNQTVGSKPSPTPIQTTPTALSISTPTPNGILSSPAPRLSPVPTPTSAPGPKSSPSPG